MPVRYGVVIIPYVKGNGKMEFLVLERDMNWRGWEFPKGGIDDGESAEQAARRELKEETGLDALVLTKTQMKCEYFYKREGQTIKSEQLVFLARVGSKEVVTSEEHSGFRWLSVEDAIERLTWDDQKRLLKSIDDKTLE